MQTVLLTPSFERQAARAGLSEGEVLEIAAWIVHNPLSGAVMVGTGGARKVRFAGRGEGKSGGYRTVHYYGGADVLVFLLGVISKGQQGNLSSAERNDLAELLPLLADAYRAGVAARIVKLGRLR
jgi:hypothetical protein